jgi:hypothetical protein
MTVQICTGANSMFVLHAQAHFHESELFYGAGYVDVGMLSEDFITFYAAQNYSDSNNSLVLSCYAALEHGMFRHVNLQNLPSDDRDNSLAIFVLDNVENYLKKHNIHDEDERLSNTVYENLVSTAGHIYSNGQVNMNYNSGGSIALSLESSDRNRIEYIIHREVFISKTRFDPNQFTNAKEMRAFLSDRNGYWLDKEEIIAVALKSTVT